jgi:hypothetical protein
LYVYSNLDDIMPGLVDRYKSAYKRLLSRVMT